MPDESLWVEKTHEEYKSRVERDTFTRDHYRGRVKDKAVAQAATLNDTIRRTDDGEVIGKRATGEVYLWRRAQGESVDAYLERVRISKFPRHHAAVVDSFSGSIFAVENDAVRNMDVFGKIDDARSFVYKLWRNADGMGTNYTTMFKRAAGRFTNYSRIWYLVETDRFTWLDTECVRNWFYTDGGTLSDVIVQETVDGRGSIADDYPKKEERVRYVHYHLEGWDRYRIEENDKGERRAVRIDEGSGIWDYPHYDDPTRTREVLPIGYIDIPFEEGVFPGYQMAQDANYLYNLLSDPRNLIRVANHPKLYGDVEDNEFERTAVELQAGANLLQGKWDFIAPPAENMSLAYKVYRDEVEEFWITSHQRYENAARQVTATEALQDEQRGRSAYLTMLSGALDELENRVLFFLAQKQFPTNPSVWLDPYVERSTDFKPVNASVYNDSIQRRYFEGPVPIGPTGLKNAARIIAGGDGIEIDDDEMEAEVDQMELEANQAAAAGAELQSLLQEAQTA